MKKWSVIIGLQFYAIALACIQHLPGVTTDEAKYLLDIPYPHPPLVRWMLSATEGMPSHALFWRIVFATLVVQAVWLVWDMMRASDQKSRGIVAGLYLVSGGVLLQAGSIMMAPLTAVQGLVFCWLYMHQDSADRHPVRVGLFTLASLFTAYQIVLFLPIIGIVVWRMRMPLWQKAFLVDVPLLILIVYTLTNPFVIASMVSAGSQNADVSLLQNFSNTFGLWIVGGSAIVSVYGVAAMIRGRMVWHAMTVFLIALYCMLSYRMYYAVLFTPVLIAALASQSSIIHRSVMPLCLSVITSIVMVLYSPFTFQMQQYKAQGVLRHVSVTDGVMMISGSFGHDWQYYSHLPVVRYAVERLDDAVAVVCLSPCEDFDDERFVKKENADVELWVRKL